MRNGIVVKETFITENQRIRTSLNLSKGLVDLRETNEAIDILIAEGGEDLFNYVEWLGMEKDPNLIVLSSVHHYYYDNNDLKDVNTIVNLKQLNEIKNIDVLFHSIFQIVSPKTNFIGSFTESKKQNGAAKNNNSSPNVTKNNADRFENGIISRIPFLNMVYNLMDSKTNRNISRSDVSLILKEHGFKVLDMTELNGITYFLAQKIQVISE
jgi:hypothetical protein